MAKVIITPTTSVAVNENLQRLADEFENVVSRDGTAPNNMQADLDMDGNDILNVDNVHANTLVLDGQIVVPDGMSVLPPNVMTKAVYDPDAHNEILFTGLPVMPEAFGAIANGVTDDKTAIEAAAAYAIANKRHLLFSPNKTYAFSQLVFPNGCAVSAKNATLRYLGGLANASDIALLVGNDNVFDELRLTSSGVEVNTDNIRLSPRSRIGLLDISADAQRAGGYTTSTGDSVYIGYVKSRKIDRPIHLDNTGNPATSGSYIGFLDIQNYVRGFRATNTDGGTIGGHNMRTRSPNGALDPGHNGLLITDCQNWYIGDGVIEDSGEHSIRLAGTVRAPVNIYIGNQVIKRSGGCGVKINPYSAVRANNIVIAGVQGIDIGQRSLGGGDNKEVVRISHADRVTVGYISCDLETEPDSGQYCLVVNDITDVRVGRISGKTNAAIRLNKDSDVDGVDYLNGPINGLYIDNYCADVDTFGSAIAIQYDGQSLGNVFIAVNGVSGFATNLVNFVGTPTVTGPIVFTGWVGGTVAPSFANAPANANVRADLMWSTRRYSGQASLFDAGYQGWQRVTPTAFDLADVKGTHQTINNSGLAAALNAYGGAYEQTRLGSVRRGMALALKQTGANAENTGIAFCCGSSGTATDALFERMVLNHQGNLSIVGALSKGSGTFKIDHPLDPENKHLIHGFVEAPRYDLIYRGSVKLVDGVGVVNIDLASNMTEGTFAALTQNVQVVSLNNYDGFGRVRAGKVVDGKFHIYAEDPTSSDEIAWVVMGERNDEFIRERDPWVEKGVGTLIPEHVKSEFEG